MPGELGNEDDSQQVGYYEHRYKPEPEVMADDRIIQKEDESKDKESQKKRLMRRWRKKLYQPQPEHSNVPDGGPSTGII